MSSNQVEFTWKAGQLPSLAELESYGLDDVGALFDLRLLRPAMENACRQTLDVDTTSDVDGSIRARFVFAALEANGRSCTVDARESIFQGSLLLSCDHAHPPGVRCDRQAISFGLLWKAVAEMQAQSGGESSSKTDLPAQWNSLIAVLRTEVRDLRDNETAQIERERAWRKSLQSISFMALSIAQPSALPDASGSDDLFESLADEVEHIITNPSRPADGFDRAAAGSRPRTGLIGLPAVFTARLDPGARWTDLEAQRKAARLLRYHFSDGAAVSCDDILRHPYVDSVPKDLLPQELRRFGGGVREFPLHLVSQPSGFRSFAIEEVEGVISQILRAAAARVSSKEIAFFIRKGDSSLGLRASRLEFGAEAKFAIRLECLPVRPSAKSKAAARGVLELTPADSSNAALAAYENCAYDVKSRALLFGSSGKALAEFRAFVRAVAAQTDAPPPSIITSSYPFASRASLERQIEMETAAASIRAEGADAALFAVAPLMLEAPSDAVRARAVFAPDAPELRFVREIDLGAPHAPTSAWNFSRQALFWLQALRAGLPAVYGFDAKSAASGRAQNRDFDLRLLRHAGIAGYVFFEAASAALDGRLSSGEHVAKPSDIMALIGSKIAALLLSTDKYAEFHKQKDLSELCSASARERIETFAKDVYRALENDDPRIYLPTGELALVDGLRSELALLRAIIAAAAAVSGGDCFAKSRVSVLGKIFGDPEKRVVGDLALADPGAAPAGGGFAMNFRGLKGLDLPRALALALAPELQERGFEIWLGDRRLQQLAEGEFRTEVTLSESASVPGTGQSIDWFAISPRFFLNGVELSSEQAASAIQGGVLEHEGRVYMIARSQLPTLARLEKFWARLQTGRIEKNATGPHARVVEIPKNEALEMLALRASGVAISGGPRWNQICRYYDSLGEPRPPMVIAASFKGELSDYQLAGVQWLADLHSLGLGGVLADDMGLGKTVQALAMLETWRERRALGHAIIVVPSSLGYNWMAEAARFAPDMPIFRVSSSKDLEAAESFLDKCRDGAVVASYGLLGEHQAFFSNRRWSCAIFDEAQNLKNISAKRTSTARLLPADFKVCLTGTPLENHLGELYSILDLVAPGCLGELKHFRAKYVNPAAIAREDVNYLRLKAKPLILRRTKREILSQLPSKFESKVAIEFSPKQKKIYRDIAISYNESIRHAVAREGEAKCQLQMLTALLRLRQACSDPGSLPGVVYRETPPKIEALMEALKEIVGSGESALVFTQFLGTLERSKRELIAAGLPHFVLHGAMRPKERETAIRSFSESPAGAVMLMTLKTGGVGLNLTKASYVFHLEPWWNPAVENQATDRAHRIGQVKSVQVFRYIMHESVEEKVELLKSRKEERFQAMFGPNLAGEANEQSTAEAALPAGGSGNPGPGLTQSDFEFLISGE